MPLVTWNDRYATGIDEIDEQHQRLFQAVNDLHEGLVEGRSRAAMDQALKFLVDYTVRHFEAEERHMEAQGYPNLAAHRNEHRLLLEEVVALAGQHGAGEAELRPMEFARFLGDWLTCHIQKTDQDYANYARTRD